jgi:hypothetical protein
MPAVPDAELRLVRRRSAIALGAGAGTVLALAAFALDASGELAAWWAWATLAVCASWRFHLALRRLRSRTRGTP